MWDSYVRLGDIAGSELQLSHFPTTDVGTRQCFAAFLAIHLNRHSSAYFEGTWIWLADFDVETWDGNQATVFSGRGVIGCSLGNPQGLTPLQPFLSSQEAIMVNAESILVP